MTPPMPATRSTLVLQGASTLLICSPSASSLLVTLTMRTQLPWIVTSLLVTATIAAATAAATDTPPEAEPEPAPVMRGTLLHQFFSVQDGSVILAKDAPLVKEPGTWTTSGTFSARDGLRIEIPLANTDPLASIVEDQAVSGWIDHTFSMRASSPATTIIGPGYGTFAWTLVEGARASELLVDCRYNDPYYCERDGKEARYTGTFPGHGPDARPHTHGNQTHRTEGLQAREFSWLLTYTIEPCSTLSCPPLSSNFDYEFSLLVDGTTFVEYWVDGASAAPAAPAVDADAAADVPADDNATDNSTEPADNDEDNSTSNNTAGEGSSSSNADSGFGPQSYKVQPKGQSPGLPLAGFVVALLAGLAFSRRRRA